MTLHISDYLISQLSEFIHAKTGLYFPENRWQDLRRGMKAAAHDIAREYGIAEDPASCIQRILSQSATNYMDILIKHLTIGETYFFRDTNLFRALEEQILPELIVSRLGKGKYLRFWSAGCCTGEEPYSLAMLISRILPDRESWNIKILATDINASFLEKAKSGIYTSWSFRGMSEEMIKRYFRKRENGCLEISPAMKKMVIFQYHNLAEEAYPFPFSVADSRGMDIIFCRNVLMYFGAEMRNQIIRRFFLSLSEKGWMVSSPSESPYLYDSRLCPVQFSGITVFRKMETEMPMSKTGQAFGLPDTEYLTGKKSAYLNDKNSPFEGGQGGCFRSTFEGMQGECLTPPLKGGMGDVSAQTPPCAPLKGGFQVPLPDRNSPFEGMQGECPPSEPEQDIHQKALALANSGKLHEAESLCKKAIAAEKLNPAYHYLLATVCQEQGRLKEAVRSFNHALYLDPKFVLAHFSLGSLMQLEGKSEASERHLRNTLSLLLSMKPEDILPCSGGMSAGKLLELVQIMMKGFKA